MSTRNIFFVAVAVAAFLTYLPKLSLTDVTTFVADVASGALFSRLDPATLVASNATGWLSAAVSRCCEVWSCRVSFFFFVCVCVLVLHMCVRVVPFRDARSAQCATGLLSGRCQ
jgi:hypothetical protein